MPSQVAAILIKIRSRLMPSASYNATILRAFAMVASLSNDNLASTSVDTKPGIIDRISQPIVTANLSVALCRGESLFLTRSEEHTSELQSRPHLVCRLLLEKKKNKTKAR